MKKKKPSKFSTLGPNKTLRDFVLPQNAARYTDDNVNVQRKHMMTRSDGSFEYNMLDGRITDLLNEKMWVCIKGSPWKAGSIWKEVVFVEPESNYKLGVSILDLYN
jgi:hypothetical protein